MDYYVALPTARVRTELNAACAVASQVAGRTIIPGGPNQHVRDEHLTGFIVHTASGLVGARLGVADNLMHIQYATGNVQDTSLTPSFADSTEVTNFGFRLNGQNPGAEPYVPVPGFKPAYMPPLPPPVNFALDNIIGNKMTLGAVAHSSDPAPPYDLVLTPVGPMSMVYIVVLTMFEYDMTLGHTTLHGQYFDPSLATGAGVISTQSISTLVRTNTTRKRPTCTRSGSQTTTLRSRSSWPR